MKVVSVINASNPIPLSPHSLSFFKTRAAEGPSSYLLPVPRGSLQEGGTQAAVGLGREIKHLNSSRHSRLLGQMHQRGDRRQTQKFRLKSSLG